MALRIRARDARVSDAAARHHAAHEQVRRGLPVQQPHGGGGRLHRRPPRRPEGRARRRLRPGHAEEAPRPAGHEDDHLRLRPGAPRTTTRLPTGNDVDGNTLPAPVGLNYSVVPVTARRRRLDERARAHPLRPDGARQREAARTGSGSSRRRTCSSAASRRSRWARTRCYGMGLMVDRRWGTPVVHHGGDMFGYHSDMIWLPEHGVGAVILTNCRLGLAPARPVPAPDPGGALRREARGGRRPRLRRLAAEGRPRQGAGAARRARPIRPRWRSSRARYRNPAAGRALPFSAAGRTVVVRHGRVAEPGGVPEERRRDDLVPHRGPLPARDSSSWWPSGTGSAPSSSATPSTSTSSWRFRPGRAGCPENRSRRPGIQGSRTAGLFRPVTGATASPGSTRG